MDAQHIILDTGLLIIIACLLYSIRNVYKARRIRTRR